MESREGLRCDLAGGAGGRGGSSLLGTRPELGLAPDDVAAVCGLELEPVLGSDIGDSVLERPPHHACRPLGITRSGPKCT